MDMINGYVFVDLLGANVYKKALGAIRSGKPVLVKDYNQVYYADAIGTATIDGDVVVQIVKGGKTITINDANAVSSEGLVANPTMENIVDLNGDKRFVGWDLTTTEITGVAYTYAKASLSGTHLMIVLAGTVDNSTVISTGTLAEVELPDYINDKIYPLFSDVVDRKVTTLYASDYTSQTLQTNLQKASGKLKITSGSLTLTASRNFRIQYDLLIDAE